tara:strand:- start:74028 stop:75875 length:1848 start_codon:yes stop_codon:yes gene_type:complete
MASEYILGISAHYHDSAASLLKDGKIIASAQEERFSRIKHDSSFPNNAIKFCLEIEELNPQDLNHIVFYEKPFTKFERLLETYLAFAPRGIKSFATSMPLWLKEKLFQKNQIIYNLKEIFLEDINLEEKLLFSEHHLSHAASAFYPSPFEDAAVLTMDGVGEWTTTSLALGNGNDLEVIKEIHFPHSLGLLYSAFTYYTGFKVNSGEYKVMGLAPYGNPIYIDTIKDNLINISDDGSFHLDLSYFDYCTGLTMTSEKFNNLFEGKPRESESALTQREMDIAASIQSVTEEVVLKLVRGIQEETSSKNLCLAGGVALNCVANGLLVKEKLFENIWIQPAAGDAGGALGAALAVNHIYLNNPRNQKKDLDDMSGSYLGPEYSQNEIEDNLNDLGAVFENLGSELLIDKVALLLSEGNAIGWMNGKMEFGPRALGARSIIADARSPEMQKQLNLKVKYRESFRPFAPSVLSEDVKEWFNLDVASPYMLLVAEVNQEKWLKEDLENKDLFGIEKLNIPRSEIPAVTHVDYSARVQTVHKETNPKYHALITKFKEITGCPVLVNTSFNVRGEPIVCSPEDAFKCFMGTELDYLVVGNCLLDKKNQDPSLMENYLNKYDLD